ncbi:MAG TPA: DMT family transporter [Allosphingosinicella sp.]
MATESTASFRDPRVLFPFLLVTLIWSSTWIVIKGQLGAVPPVWSVSYRFLISGVVMIAIAAIRGESLRLRRGGYVLAVLLGTFQFVVNYNFVYASEQTITSGLAAVVFALLVVPNAILARIFFGERVSGSFVLGSAVAMAGVALLFAQEMRQSTASTHGVLVGLAFVLVAVLAASISNVMQLMPAIRSRPVAAMLGWAMLYGGAINGLFAWFHFGPPTVEPTWTYLGGLLYLSVIASALAFFLYYGIIRAIGAAKAAYSSVLIPIVAMAISTVMEGYRWSPLAAGGGLLAIAGLLIALRAGKPPATTPTD